MRECCDKKTIIHLFCSTAFKDENHIELRKYFENKGNDIRVKSLYEDGKDQLQKLIDELSQEAQEEDKEVEEGLPAPEVNRCDDIIARLTNLHLASIGKSQPEPEEPKKKKSKKSKYRCQEYMIVLDDLSNELKSKSLLTLLKKNRHYRSKIIISSQWLHDLLPESRKQIALFMVFKGFPEKKI